MNSMGLISYCMLIIMMLQCIECMTDCEAVVVIYKTMGGREFDPESPCGIPGVEVDANQKVIRINWDHKDRCGYISPKIGSLNCIKWNQVTGMIPNEIGDLINLQVLDLSGNQLIGKIPKEIGKLRNLAKLWIFQNGINGEIPPAIGDLVNLRWLDLSGNQLEGEIPNEIKNLRNIRIIDLSKNKLTGKVPESIKDLHRLRRLRLSSNNLNIPEWLQYLKNVVELDLGNTPLSEQINHPDTQHEPQNDKIQENDTLETDVQDSASDWEEIDSSDYEKPRKILPKVGDGEMDWNMVDYRNHPRDSSALHDDFIIVNMPEGLRTFHSDLISKDLLKTLKDKFQWKDSYIPWNKLTYKDFNTWPKEIEMKDLRKLSDRDFSQLLNSMKGHKGTAHETNKLLFSPHFTSRFEKDFMQ